MKRKNLMAVLPLMMALSACGQEANVRDTERPQEERSEESSEARGEQSGESQGEFVGAPVSESSRNMTEDVQILEPDSTTVTESQMTALSASSVAMMKEVVAEANPEDNVLISPTSAIMAFGMAENGAAGNTLAQMEQAVNGGLSIGEMNPLLCDLSQRFRDSDDVTWNVANSVWFRDDGLAAPKAAFLEKAASYYNADVWMAPFDESTVQDVNNWVDRETLGMIPGIVDGDGLDDVRALLVNAIAFEGEWQNEYSEDDIIDADTFTNADGSTSEVTMLFSEEGQYITVGESGVGFLRPYKGGMYSFVGILPNEGVSTQELVAAMGEMDFAGAIRNAEYGTVSVRMPEFSLDYGMNMNEMMKNLGVTDAFDPELADLSETMESAEGQDWQLYIGKVLQKAHIEVNREGTRAAAATAIMEMDNCVAVPDDTIFITLNRPFVYAVVDNMTGLPVFLGAMNTME